MGTNYKRAIFNEHLQQNIVGWAQKAKKKKERKAESHPGQGSSHESGGVGAGTGGTGIQLGSIFPRKASAPGDSTSVSKADGTS